MKNKFSGKFGFEIECISKIRNRLKLNQLCVDTGFESSSDGSITDYNYDTHEGHEFKSKVYDLKDLKIAFQDVRKFYKLIQVNRSCGLHIHFSFEKMSNYYKLLCWKFIEQFQNQYDLTFTSSEEQERKTRRFSKFYESEINFNLDTNEQVSTPGKIHGREYTSKPCSRYHCINFNAFNHYKTIEFRVFPATNKIMKFEKYINFLIKNINDFLNNEEFNGFSIEEKPIKKPKDNGKIVIKEKITKEEIREIKTQINLGDNTHV